MGTPVEAVYTAFYDKLDRDASFFDAGNSIEESEEIAKERSHTYLKEAVSYWKRKQSADISLRFDKEKFEADLTDDEIDLIAMIMVYMHYQKTVVALKSKMHIFSSADIIFRGNIDELEISSLMSGDGVVISGYNTVDGKQREIIAYYVYHRK